MELHISVYVSIVSKFQVLILACGDRLDVSLPLPPNDEGNEIA